MQVSECRAREVVGGCDVKHAGWQAMKHFQQDRQIEPDAILLCRTLTVEHAAGYRDVTIRCLARDGERTFHLDLVFSAFDAIRLGHCMSQVSAIAWEDGNRPIDARPDESDRDLWQSATDAAR